MTPEQLETAIQDLFDGNCEGEQLRALVEQLESDPEARELYRSHVRINAILSMQAEHLAHPQQSVVPVDLLIKRQKRRILRFSLIATAAASLVAALLMMGIILPSPSNVTVVASPGSEFSMTHSTKKGAPAPKDGVLQVGSRLRVTRGTVELTMDSGVRAVLRAPADLTLAADERINLHRGIGWFDVPKKAVGFQVATEEFLLTDLGTTFGIISNSHSNDEAHVFSGTVELQRLDGDRKVIEIGTGAARAINWNGEWEDIEFSPATFLTELPASRPPPPYIYWSFDEESTTPFATGGTWPVADSIRSTRGFAGEGPEFIDGKVGSALSFDRSRDHIETDWRGIEGRETRSVAMWIKLPLPVAGTEYKSTLLTWGRSNIASNNSGWSLRATTRDVEIAREGRPEIAGRTLFQVRLGASWINGSTDLADGNWHHIATRFDGGIDPAGLPNIQLFVDGLLEETEWRHQPRPSGFSGSSWPPAFDTKLDATDSNPLLIGRSKHRPDASCDATIDEVYIFDGSIDHTLIRSLAAARPGWQP